MYYYHNATELAHGIAQQEYLRHWYERLLPDTRHFLNRALDSQHLQVYIDGVGHPHVQLLLYRAFDYENDTEYVSADLLDDAIELWSRYGHDGFIAWTAFYRQCDAVRYGENYTNAMAYFI